MEHARVGNQKRRSTQHIQINFFQTSVYYTCSRDDGIEADFSQHKWLDEDQNQVPNKLGSNSFHGDLIGEVILVID